MKWLGNSAGCGRPRAKTPSVLNVPCGNTAKVTKIVTTGLYFSASVAATPALAQRHSSSPPDAPGGVPSFAGASIPFNHTTIVHLPASDAVTDASARAFNTSALTSTVEIVSRRGLRTAPIAATVTAIASAPVPLIGTNAIAIIGAAAIMIAVVIKGTVIPAADMVIRPSPSPPVHFVAVAGGGVVNAVNCSYDTGGGDSGRGGPSDEWEAAASERTTILAPVHGTNRPPPVMLSFLILLPSLPLPGDAHGGHGNIKDDTSSLLRDGGVMLTATPSSSLGGRRCISGRPRIG